MHLRHCTSLLVFRYWIVFAPMHRHPRGVPTLAQSGRFTSQRRRSSKMEPQDALQTGGIQMQCDK